MMREIAFDDFEALVGQELGVSDWVPVLQDRIDKFADATDDFQWIHVDRARARERFGGTLAHGFLTLSMLAPLVESIWKPIGISHALNYGVEKLRFIAPVKCGSSIRCRETLLSAERRNGGLMLTRNSTVEIDRVAKPALVAISLMLVFPV